MSAAVFLDALRTSDLEEFYLNFADGDIRSIEALTKLSVAEYSRFGVTDPDARKRLFSLIQNYTRPSPELHQPTIASSSVGKSSRLSLHSAGGGANSGNGLNLRDAVNMRPSTGTSVKFQIKVNNTGISTAGLNVYGVPAGSNRLTTDQDKSGVDMNERIRVCVRKRPLNSKESARGEKDIAQVLTRRTIVMNEPKTKVDLTKYIERHQFVFDDVFDENSTNEQVYQKTAYPLVNSIFHGAKATCFAYGQTGSGKTFTMLDPNQGLYMLACRDIFHNLRQPQYSNLIGYVSFYEIYQGHLYDLLNERKKLFAREDGNQNVIISGIAEFEVHAPEDLMDVFDRGSLARSTGQTGANDESSRSHAILQIVIKKRGPKAKIVGKFSFIDLAGSERGADRGETDSKTRMEGSEINKSLLALKECIRALDQDSKHTPFRQSKLTQVLKDSFIGNSRTCMIATVSPNSTNSEHTLNTLRYADRVKELKGDSMLHDPDYRAPMEVDENDDDDEDYTDPYLRERYMVPTDVHNPALFNSPAGDLLLDEEFPEHMTLHSEEDRPPAKPQIAQQFPARSKIKNTILSNLNQSTQQLPASPKLAPRQSNLKQLAPINARQSPTKTMQSPGRLSFQVAPQVSKNTTEERQEIKKRPTERDMTMEAEEDQMPYDFSQDQIGDFVRSHRQQIREITDCCKDETKLLANISAANNNDGSNNNSSDAFVDYMFELDKLLERKFRTMVDLRKKIKSLMLSSQQQS